LERFWWGSVFLINVPIVTVGAIAVLAIVPESRNPRPGRLDLFGVLLSIAGLMAFVYGIIDGGDHGFDRPVVWLSIALGLALLYGFIRLERASDHPSLNVNLFRDPRFSAAVGATGLVFFAGLGTLFFLSFYLQLVRGYSPLRAGLLMTPFAAAQLIFAPRSAAMVRRFGPRHVCAVGLGLVTVALIGFALVGIGTPVWLLLVLTFVQGAGMANVVPPTTESIMSALPPQEAGIGSAVSNIFRQVGAALGVAVLGSVLSAVYRRQVTGSLYLLPPPARPIAGESLSGAYGVAGHAGPAGPQFLAKANEAFVTAMHWAAGGSAVVAAGGVAVVLAFLPLRANPIAEGGAPEGGAPEESPAPPPAPPASRRRPTMRVRTARIRRIARRRDRVRGR
jgi:Na+/melibiose symporter-like transporter